MRTTSCMLIGVVCSLTLLQLGAAAPTDDAIAQYRAYVAVVRAGKADDVVKLVEPVPDTSKPLLNARIKQAIALEAMKKEMVAQMGPAKVGEEGWEIGGLPYDDVLANLKGSAHGADMVGLRAIDPKTGAEGTVGWMVRRDGKWLVPAALVMDLPPTPGFIEPDPAQRAEMIKYANAITDAANAVLKRLKAKQFNKPSEVQAALGQEIQKAGG